MKKLLACIAAALCAPAGAYEVPTHQVMTNAAAIGSSLESRIGDVGAPLGITSLEHFSSDGKVYDFGGILYEIGYPVLTRIVHGSAREDDWPRFLNHFHNPLAPAGQEGYSYGPVSGHPSLAWGLEPAPIPAQELSLRDAREYLRLSITAPTQPERKLNFSRLVTSLGHVVHLVQDVGQPQHARNDSHGVSSYFKRGYEAFVGANLGELPLGGYANVRMQEAREYWVSSAGSGLAQFSNRNFVTTGTNFGGTRSGNTLNITPAAGFPQPDGSGLVLEKTQIQDLPFAQRPPSLIGEIWFVGTPVTDAYSGSTELNPRTSTFSIFDEDLAHYNFSWTFTLNRFNFIEQRNRLAPRAVGYSAGLIDHFLRGRLRIEPPDNGLYAYADHASATEFETLKVKVTNDTPQEAMSGGTLLAVATYHRNGCYTPDLSGEFYQDPNGVLVTPCPEYRSLQGSISFSAEQSLSLASGESRDLELTFSPPIPMDATDLRLQLLYRGALGLEAEGVAVGMRDLSEPTFLAIGNGTDVFELPGGFYPYVEIMADVTRPEFTIVDRNANGVYDSPPDVDVRGGDIAYQWRFNGVPVAAIPALPEGRFARLAVIANAGPIPHSITASGAGFFSQVSSYVSSGKVNQLDPESGAYMVGVVHDLRGTRQWASVTYYRYHPTPVLDLDAMPPSQAADALTPFALQTLP